MNVILHHYPTYLLLISYDIFLNILEVEFAKAYNRKIQQLESDLEYQLAFLLQKQRIVNYNPNLMGKDIEFTLNKHELNSDLEGKEYNDAIAKALTKIQEVDGFILKDFHRSKGKIFSVVCHPIDSQKLEDSSRLKLQLSDIRKLAKY